MTPKRPLATCLMALRRQSPLGSAGSAPRPRRPRRCCSCRRCVHGDGQGLVRLLADGAEAHRAGGEALDDLRLAGSTSSSGIGEPLRKLEQAAQCAEAAVLVVDQVGVLLEGLVAHPCRTACWSLNDGVRVEQVVLAVVRATGTGRQRPASRCAEALVGEGVLVSQQRFARQHVQADALDARGGPGEVLVHQPRGSGRWPRRSARPVALQVEMPIFEKIFSSALVDRLDVVLACVLDRDAAAGSNSSGSEPPLTMSSMVSKARYGLMALAP